MGARNAKARLGKPGHHGAHEQECGEYSGLGGSASRVPVALILRVAELAGQGVLAIHTLVDAHGATEADVRAGIAAVEDRIVGARREPHPMQLLGVFEAALPPWGPEVRAVPVRPKRRQQPQAAPEPPPQVELELGEPPPDWMLGPPAAGAAAPSDRRSTAPPWEGVRT